MSSKQSKNKLSLQTDIPILTLTALAVLAVPRVIIHDLHLISLESPIYKILAITPFILWLLVAIFRKNKRPVYDFMVLGLLFGALLAVTHQITWNASWGDNVPRLQGNLEGKLDPGTEALLLRLAAFVSSLATGITSGAGAALVAWIASKNRSNP